MNEILIPILAVTIIGLICGVGLAVASHVMAVKEDERFPAIRECLPGANCGACGFTGCDGYAKALLTPGTKTNLCVPGGAEAAKKLAEVLGVEAEAVEPKVAIVRCGGDCEHTSPKEDYRGIASCLAAKLFFGGKGTVLMAASASATAQRSVRMTRFPGTTALRLSTSLSASAAACAQRPARSK
ncbi:MAG: RnfABCDGE type electron transport complex subunit B [Oscillospiraceae bacterium]